MKTQKEIGALEIVKVLVEHGHRALYAGGCVRDMVMGVASAGDIDIATSAEPRTVRGLFEHVIPVGEHFGVEIVMHRDIPFEVATFRKDKGASDGRHPDSVEFAGERDDALRRDFTINGMFFDPLTDTVLDYVGGREDVAKAVIRAIGEPAQRFSEDYLRLIRAVRFAARLGFAIEEKTWAALRDNATSISRISAERVFIELDKMLRGPHADVALSLLHDSGLLAAVLPEVEALSGVEQPPEFHPEGDVLAHTVLALSLMRDPTQVTAWSVLLHDIGKPATKVIADRVRFPNHDHRGASMSEHILRRLKAPGTLLECVYEVVDNHMNFINVQKMRLSTLKRFMSRPTMEDELEVHRVDCLASHGDISNYTFIRQKQAELSVEEIRPPSLISGKDLIELGYKPGPVFGKILGEVYDLQLEEKLGSREEAMEWVKNNFSIS